VVSQAVFGGWLPFKVKNYPLDYLCVPLLVWAAFRFGQRETATAALVLAVFAIWGTLRGFGPFVGETQNESLLLLQAFMGITDLMALALAAVVEERRRAEEQFRLVVEAAPTGMVMVNGEGTILLANALIERLFGYRQADLQGQPIEVLVPERFRGQHPSHRRGFLAAPSPRAMGVGRDLYGLRKDGSEFPVEIGLNPMKTPGGMLVMASIIDITERKRTETSRERLVRELQDALEQIKTLRGLLPICASCKKIRNDRGYWEHIEEYIQTHSQATFTHGLCQECVKTLYPQVWKEVKEKPKDEKGSA
jgi:PAS domain S-box-containing protein